MKLRLNTRYRVLKRVFRHFLTRKFSTQLVLTYMALGALPIVIVGIILISLTQTTVESYIFQRNLETARRASNEISLFIREPLTILHTLAQTRDILDMDRFSQSRIINRIKEENSLFRKISVLDSSGIVVATTSFGEEFENYRHLEFYRIAIRGKEYFSDVYFTESSFPVMQIALPVIRFNQVIGILATEIDLKNIWDLVDNITIGKTGNAFLLSAEGIVIAHKNKEKVLERENFASYRFFEDLKQNREGTTQIFIENQPLIIAYFPIPVLHWGIVIQQSQKEAFSLAKQLQYRVFFFVGIMTIVAAFLGIMGVRRFTRPLNELVKGARVYANGNLEHRINMQRKDELAELAHEFNAMASSLSRNQKELQRMERLAALSRFAALVSHEIRNPLNSMNINMQILKRLIYRKDIVPEQKIKYLNVLSEEISRINELVTNFLTITRPPELTLILTDIHQILNDVVLVQRARAISSGIAIRTEFVNGPVLGMYDHSQLKQVFHNIIVNAFEAMNEGGELELRTEILNSASSEEKSKIRIYFKDTGVGISESEIKDIFDFYYTTKKTGTGLGLAIAKQIIEAHKGSILITSKPGEGTVVTVELNVEKY